MKSTIFNTRFFLAAAVVLVASFARMIHHPWNMTPVGAVALFGGAYFASRFWAILLPLFSLWLSDLYLNNVVYAQPGQSFVWLYEGFYWQYLPIVLTSVMAMYTLRRINVRNFVFSAVGSSIFFFLVSNFGVWASGTMYAHTFSGFMMCYAAGLPFLAGTLLGAFAYGAVLFGGMEIASVHYPELAPVRVRSNRR